MPPERAVAPTGLILGFAAVPTPWRKPMSRQALVSGLLALLFRHDWTAMVRQWWNISTYNHMLLVPPIIAWLAWQRRRELAQLQPSIWWPALLGMALAAFLWLLGAVSGLDLAKQAGAVALMGASVPLLLGPRVTAALVFPLCYMMFLIPFGEELVALLQTVTARITVALVHFSGVPATIDGVFIDTPAGLFEVAEACSGVKFLIAMIAFGLLMAHVCFIDRRRRAALLVACVIVPVIANGVRAWGTIYAAQFFGVAAAAGLDHIVYGWFFFALVITLVIAGAWRFFDRPLDRPIIDAGAIRNDTRLAELAVMATSPRRAITALLAIVLGVQGWALLASRVTASLPPKIDLPAVPGFVRVDYAPRLWWEPRGSGAGHRLLGCYADAAGHRVDVFYALYASQGEGHEAGGFGEGALVPQSSWAWQGSAASLAGGRGDRLQGSGRVERVAMTWYRSGDVLTGSNARLKLTAMADRLRLQAHPTVMLIVSSEQDTGRRAEEAIDAFVRAAGPLGPWIDHIGGER